MQKVKVKGQSVRKIKWKQTDGQTDDGGDCDCITSRANAVGNNLFYDHPSSDGRSTERLVTNVPVDLSHIRIGDSPC